MRNCICLGLALVVACSALADEKTVNPDYVNWARFAKGTTVVRTSTSTRVAGGPASRITETQKLVDVTPDKVVLEVFAISEVPGSTPFGTVPAKQDVEKFLPPAGDGKKNQFKLQLPGTIEEGTKAERITVPGGKFDAKWAKTVKENGMYRTEGTSWVSDEVPGRLVKSVSTTNQNGKPLFSTICEVAKIQKP